MRFKPNVDFIHMDARLLLQLDVIDQVHMDVARRLAIVTSANDSHEHRPSSAHNDGKALDLRTNDLPDQETKDELVAELQRRLGPDFFVQFEDNLFIEGVQKRWEHIHLGVRRYPVVGE